MSRALRLGPLLAALPRLLRGELRAVRSIAVKAPETNIFQMRIQFMAEEGSQVEPGDPLLDFDRVLFVKRHFLRWGGGPAQKKDFA